jgi:hypothetical protein
MRASWVVLRHCQTAHELRQPKPQAMDASTIALGSGRTIYVNHLADLPGPAHSTIIVVPGTAANIAGEQN